MGRVCSAMHKAGCRDGPAGWLPQRRKLASWHVMARMARDRINAEVQGRQSAHFGQVGVRGLSPSAWVREILVDATGRSDPELVDCARGVSSHAATDRVRVSLRMSRAQAEALIVAEREAGLGHGAYVAGLVDGVPVLSEGADRASHVAELTASTAEVAMLSRDVRSLLAFLRMANIESARAFRLKLETLADDVHKHLALASRVLAALQPRARPQSTAARRQASVHRARGAAATMQIAPNCSRRSTSILPGSGAGR